MHIAPLPASGHCLYKAAWCCRGGLVRENCCHDVLQHLVVRVLKFCEFRVQGIFTWDHVGQLIIVLNLLSEVFVDQTSLKRKR